MLHHPCFNPEARKRCGRIHLPVARHCNLQCNFCNRKFDCVNENRPGVASQVLTPAGALDYLEAALRHHPEIAVAGLAGPGDPFADPDATMATLRLLRAAFPALLLCVATNGLGIATYIDELVDLRVSHVTMTVNAVDPDIGAAIYAWVDDDSRRLYGIGAATWLWRRQRESIIRLKAGGIAVKINSVLIPGVNDRHMVTVAQSVATLGADVFNCMPMVVIPDTPLADRREPDRAAVCAIRQACRRFLPQMTHCARCRADAVGLL